MNSMMAQKNKNSSDESFHIGLEAEARKEVTALLNILLSDEFTLYAKTRGAHWNVRGSHFFSLHGLFEKQYEALDEIIDEVAERARMLGGMAVDSLMSFLTLTRLENENLSKYDERDFLMGILIHHEAIICNLRIDIKACERHGDYGTADLFTGILAQHEKMAWMLRASLEKI
jgi:starvation-inducible DNA-binding protein